MKETIEKIIALQVRLAAAEKIVDLAKLEQELKKITALMQESDFWQDQARAVQISRQAAELDEQIKVWQGLQQEAADLLEISLADQKDQGVNLRPEIDQQVEQLEQKFARQELILLLSGKHDQGGAIVSIHAGAGGDDAQDWAEILSRMYLRWADRHNYQSEILAATRGSTAGLKSITIRLSGTRAYGQLKGEYGVHRLVRLSPFDADNARHTSFALVEVLPELADVDEVVIDPTDLKIDTFRSGGAGGQHVNTTDSAVRLTHLPTRISVSCQNERSQAANKETARKILQAKLQYLQAAQRVDEIKQLKGEHKQAAWGNQIRSYVLQPYKLVKDLRTEYEETDPDRVLAGEIDGFIESYLRWAAGK